MENMKYFGFEDFDEFAETFWTTGAFDIGYHSTVFDRDVWFTLTVDGSGYHIYPEKEFLDTHSACFDSAREMVDNYIFPDGTPMKDVFENTIHS